MSAARKIATGSICNNCKNSFLDVTQEKVKDNPGVKLITSLSILQLLCWNIVSQLEKEFCCLLLVKTVGPDNPQAQSYAHSPYLFFTSQVATFNGTSKCFVFQR